MSAITAKYVRTLDDFQGDARLYELSEPIPYGYDYDDDLDKPEGETRFVVVSAATVMLCGSETYIFPANEAGEVIKWGELNGSFRGALDHSAALVGAGWEVAA